MKGKCACPADLGIRNHHGTDAQRMWVYLQA
eukprot:CAMPEP_0179204536 /NCGR_PEP_ID=MMETSP0796-20121207/101963_1 /TAXON_ID=73915 /ORGANISM="Pyrodinium bahamense, Strain pbaha01" /LENGTH=30 /DNA_ID= /DNA_START= /DNA_END= /DNA_ORIENTATION=